MEYYQGDIIKINSYKNKFIIISKNAFIRATHVFHVCPLFDNYPEGPLHIKIKGRNDTQGVVICEQMKLIDPSVRNCSRIDNIPYESIMNISDAIQGIFEYD